MMKRMMAVIEKRTNKMNQGGQMRRSRSLMEGMSLK